MLKTFNKSNSTAEIFLSSIFDFIYTINCVICAFGDLQPKKITATPNSSISLVKKI